MSNGHMMSIYANHHYLENNIYLNIVTSIWPCFFVNIEVLHFIVL
jgi:hypothetical protein